MKFQLRLVFLIGSLLGFSIGLLLLIAYENHRNEMFFSLESLDDFKQWLRSEHLQILKNASPSSTSSAQYLYDRVRISCVVLSSKQRQARAIVGTWGRHCNSLSFVAEFEDKYVPVDLKTSLQDPHIACKTLHKVVERHFVSNSNQWLFLSDDTTFAVVENLRYLVAPLNTTDVYYLGHAVRKSTLRGLELIVNTLHGGIVLSQGAVLAILLTLSPDCAGKHEQTSFDETIARFLIGTNVSRFDTRDQNGSARFIARPVEKLLVPEKVSPYDSFLKESLYAPKLGKQCCSPHAIALHGVDALNMHFFEYLVNRVHIGKPSKQAPPLRSEEIPPVSLEGDVPDLPAAPRHL